MLGIQKARERRFHRAWRWRHEVIAFLTPTELSPVDGIVEAGGTYFRLLNRCCANCGAMLNAA